MKFGKFICLFGTMLGLISCSPSDSGTKKIISPEVAIQDTLKNAFKTDKVEKNVDYFFDSKDNAYWAGLDYTSTMTHDVFDMLDDAASYMPDYMSVIIQEPCSIDFYSCYADYSDKDSLVFIELYSYYDFASGTYSVDISAYDKEGFDAYIASLKS